MSKPDCRFFQRQGLLLTIVLALTMDTGMQATLQVPLKAQVEEAVEPPLNKREPVIMAFYLHI